MRSSSSERAGKGKGNSREREFNEPERRQFGRLLKRKTQFRTDRTGPDCSGMCFVAILYANSSGAIMLEAQKHDGTHCRQGEINKQCPSI